MHKVDIFDTTLRDGEQSPGCSLNAAEKLEIAQQLARTGVDVIEAGFAASSPGDFAAVKTIAEQVRGPVIAAFARCAVGYRSGGGSGQSGGTAADSYCGERVEYPSGAQDA